MVLEFAYLDTQHPIASWRLIRILLGPKNQQGNTAMSSVGRQSANALQDPRDAGRGDIADDFSVHDTH